MPGKPLGIRPGAREWAGNTAVLLTKASLKPRSVQDTQDETSRPCSVGHTDGDANDDTLFSGEMPGAVRASCVILMEPHEALMSSCLLRQQLQADSTASGHTLLILLKELLGLTKRRLLRHEQASTPAQQEKSAQFSVPVQASSRAAGMEQRCLL
ncbi:hypothetical protein MJT46_008823 [Ovis ammon polii x Ovis aries]|nr:hypothetical protein MJT46_008823 [Ovis ammon polii x Ovis aries]